MGCHAIPDHIQFDRMECVITQLRIAFEHATIQLCIMLKCATINHIFEHVTAQPHIEFIQPTAFPFGTTKCVNMALT